jgi:hypothetical protein
MSNKIGQSSEMADKKLNEDKKMTTESKEEKKTIDKQEVQNDSDDSDTFSDVVVIESPSFVEKSSKIQQQKPLKATKGQIEQSTIVNKDENKIEEKSISSSSTSITPPTERHQLEQQIIIKTTTTTSPNTNNNTPMDPPPQYSQKQSSWFSSTTNTTAPASSGFSSFFGGGAGQQQGDQQQPQPATCSASALRLLGELRARLQPWGDFFRPSKFGFPPGLVSIGPRVKHNLEHFLSNYLCLFIALLIYCILTSLLMLLTLVALAGLCYTIYQRTQKGPIFFGSYEVPPSLLYTIALMVCIPLFYLANAGSVMYWVIGTGLFLMLAHAIFYASEEIPGQEFEVVTVVTA